MLVPHRDDHVVEVNGHRAPPIERHYTLGRRENGGQSAAARPHLTRAPPPPPPHHVAGSSTNTKRSAARTSAGTLSTSVTSQAAACRRGRGALTVRGAYRIQYWALTALRKLRVRRRRGSSNVGPEARTAAREALTRRVQKISRSPCNRCSWRRRGRAKTRV